MNTNEAMGDNDLGVHYEYNDWKLVDTHLLVGPEDRGVKVVLVLERESD